MIAPRGLRRGKPGAAGAAFNLGAPVAISATLGTARQAADPAKPARISVMVRADYTLTVAGNLTDTVEIRIAASAPDAAGAGGVAPAQNVFGLTGIALSVGMGIQQQNQMSVDLPAGWYFCVRRTSGTRASIVSTFSQPLA